MPEVQRYLDWKSRDKVECKAALDGMCAQRRLNRPGDTLTLAVERRSDGVLVGLGAEVGVCGPASLLPRNVQELG